MSINKEDVTIRRANVEDMGPILDLVKELAKYENAEDQVKTTIEDYEKNFLSGVFDATVAEVDEGIIGMVLYFVCWSTWKGRMMYLDDFVVKENFRQFGVGQMLFDELCIEAKIRGCKLVKWQVLDWNEPAIKFYKKNESIIEKEWWNCKKFT